MKIPGELWVLLGWTQRRYVASDQGRGQGVAMVAKATHNHL